MNRHVSVFIQLINIIFDITSFIIRKMNGYTLYLLADVWNFNPKEWIYFVLNSICTSFSFHADKRLQFSIWHLPILLFHPYF